MRNAWTGFISRAELDRRDAMRPVFGVKIKLWLALGIAFLAIGFVLAVSSWLPLSADPRFASSWQRIAVQISRNDSSLDRSIWRTRVFKKAGALLLESSSLESELKKLGFSERYRSSSWQEWQSGDTVVSISQESDGPPFEKGSLLLEVSERQKLGLVSEWQLVIQRIVAGKN